MSIDEYFHKTLLASIIVGPALTMTLPFVYWVQYQNMLLFPSLIYYLVASASVSTILHFFIFVVPDNRRKRKKKLLMLPYYPSKPSGENSPKVISNTAEPIIEKEPVEITEPIIYNKVKEEPPTLSPSDSTAISQAQEEEAMRYKKLFHAFVEKYVKEHIPDGDAQILLDNMYLAIDNRTQELDTTEQVPRLPYQVKTTSKFTSLVSEDIYHIGFVVKFFLKKRNEYGAAFIREVFPNQLKDIEFSTIATKLASKESHDIHIPIPDVCWDGHGKVKKRFNDHITEDFIKRI